MSFISLSLSLSLSLPPRHLPKHFAPSGPTRSGPGPKGEAKDTPARSNSLRARTPSILPTTYYVNTLHRRRTAIDMAS
ncbi:hypothetical protein LY76DRAFT_306005 [Colletotrichum caudatum]|nr:hypothetical protein LY76DRAFT_306005 [Colletotrichum caudatum]